MATRLTTTDAVSGARMNFVMTMMMTMMMMIMMTTMMMMMRMTVQNLALTLVTD